MHAADTFDRSHNYRFIHSSKQGWHTAPQAMLDDYDELQQLIKDGQEARSWGKQVWVNKEIEQQAEAVAVRLHRGTYGDLVVEHLQPSFAKLLTHFAADRRAAGAYAMRDTVTLDMLDEDDHMRAAIVRVHSVMGPYHAIRRTWADLRGTPEAENSGNYGPPLGDPQGVHSPLAEVANIGDLAPHWKTAGQYGGQPWPWSSQALHVKLGWLIDHDAELWLPTKREQDALWNQLHQKPRRTTAA
ncbi:hypothetical protein ACFWIB_26840 [Streptomyces sp. NPDC127051]|uniref:hypothetical protein n=1 Tax=Streptomyces sp. NPDC127051 TaxID=3347119 RepID=UPI0036644DC3